MTEQNPNITIKALARQNVVTLITSGAVGMLLCALVANFFWHDYRLQIVMIFMVSVVSLIIGLFKHFEPENSFELTPQGMKYIHRYGEWQLDWENIMIIDQPSITEGVETKALAYIGIKLHDTQVLAKLLSRRMANNMLQEQRDLYFLACQVENIGLFERQINDKPYKLDDGEKVIGPIGAYLHRCDMLRKSFGYDVYIPINALDRPPEEFVALLKQCKASAKGYQQEST